MLQLIGDPEDWRRISQFILAAVGAGAGIFVAGALQEAGKDAWRNRARAISLAKQAMTSPFSLLRVFSGKSTQVENRTLALPIAGSSRNAGIAARDYSHEEIAVLVVGLARCADQLKRRIEELQSQKAAFKQNGDMSIAIIPNDDGSFSLEYTLQSQGHYGEKQTERFGLLPD